MSYRFTPLLLSGARGVLREADGAFIPEDPSNTDWTAYLAWRETDGIEPGEAGLRDYASRRRHQAEIAAWRAMNLEAPDARDGALQALRAHFDACFALEARAHAAIKERTLVSAAQIDVLPWPPTG
jgi:hypothetical protein